EGEGEVGVARRELGGELPRPPAARPGRGGAAPLRPGGRDARRGGSVVVARGPRHLDRRNLSTRAVTGRRPRAMMPPMSVPPGERRLVLLLGGVQFVNVLDFMMVAPLG